MDSRAKVLGNSVHQQLLVFPLELFGTAVIFDRVYLVIANATMALTAFWMIISGIAGGLVAAPLEMINWLAIPSGTRAKAIGLTSGLTNLAVLLLFIISGWLGWSAPNDPQLPAHPTPIAAFFLAFLGGWLGGELVSRLDIGVHDGAHLNSPNLLSGRPATEQSSQPSSE